MKFAPQVAPQKAAILPLVKDEQLIKISKEIHSELKQNWFVQYDEVGTVGRRYRRQDEIGTPYCVTIDFDTLEDDAVTVRSRDTTDQKRVKIPELQKAIQL